MSMQISNNLADIANSICWNYEWYNYQPGQSSEVTVIRVFHTELCDKQINKLTYLN